MRIACLRDRYGASRLGIVEGKLVYPGPALHGGLEMLLRDGPAALQEATQSARAARPLPLDETHLAAPIARPYKFLGIGGNYASHLKEVEALGAPLPQRQVWFNKQTTCIQGPHDDILIPRQSAEVDYEGELAVVIGRVGRRIAARDAHLFIAGYMVCNDVSARDIQRMSPTATLGKSFDTHGPIGPWLVTPDEVDDPQDLLVRTWVNGELRQTGRTSEMRYTIAAQIAELSAVFTLEPGDILATGTPAGVGAAAAPPRYLHSGDVVRVEIERIGAIENRFVDEPSGDAHR